MAKYIVFSIIAYLIGNISPATILGKLHGLDIKSEGSGNAGTTNALRVLGWQAALVTLTVDILKGVIAVNIGFSFNERCGELCMLAVILGHCFPVLLKFKGGKGVATAFGAALAINWPSAFAALLVAALGVLLTKRMSVGSIAAAVTYPLFVLYYFAPEQEKSFMAIAIAMCLLLLFNHRSNILRLIRGQESKLSFGKDKEKCEAAKAEEIIDSEALDDEVREEIRREHKKLAVEGEEAVDYYAAEAAALIPEEERKRVAVIGCGSFGTSLANLLANKGHSVTVYGRNRAAVDEIRATRQNVKYLPGVLLSNRLRYTGNIITAAKNRDVIIFAVPAQQFRSVAKKMARYVKGRTVIVNLAKGIEDGTLKTMSQAAAEVLPGRKYVALSGPTHAEEIARNYPASVVAASTDASAAEFVQDLFMTGKFRVYTSPDVIGVEVGAALKNVIAIGTGISDGMKLGDNTRAALMTRGIHEITKLGLALGADEVTFSGLSGIGDLMVTCSSDLSRNRRCGLMIGAGKTPEEAVSEIGTVEGFYTVDAAHELASKLDVEMPITDALWAIIHGRLKPEEAMSMLMERDRKGETK